MGGVAIVTFPRAAWAVLGRHFSADRLGDFDTHDSGRDGDDGVSGHHHQGGEELTDCGLGGDVAVSHRGQGDDRPVHALRNTVEAGVFLSFDQVHRRPENQDEGDHGEEEHRDLDSARPESADQRLSLGDEVPHLQNPEDPQQAKRSDHHQRLSAWQDQTQIGGEDREQVDDSVKTARISDCRTDTPKPDQILDRKSDREDPLPVEENLTVALMVGADTLQEHHRGREEDRPE